MELRSSTQSSGARSAIRANVDKVLRDSENQLKADNPDILELEANKAYLEQARDELNVYDTQVLTEMTDETKIQQEYKQGSEYRMKIAKTVAKLRAKINSNYKDSKDEDTASNASQDGKFYAKLPKLEVPSFSGNPMDWLPFWDSFEAAVVKNGELTNGQKLQYLLSFLDGDAKKMQPVGKFMSIYDECEHHIRSLMALGLEEDTFGKMFAPLILSKIPERVREQLNRNNNGQPWTLADLQKQLRDEIRFREMSSTYNVESAGLDQYKKFVTNEVMKLSNGLELIGSKLGFIMSGPFESSPGTEKMTTSECMVTTLAHPVSGLGKTDIDLETFWSLEDIGIKDSPYQDDDESAIEQFNSTVKKVDGRYEVTWPYREKNPDIPTNFGLALGRLKALLQRFEGQGELFTEYANILEDQEQKGVIEEVTEVPSKFLVHYVPHHFVLDKSRTSTKMRMVFDASAKSAKNKLSINECLLRGPVILEDLCGMLIRFRLGKIALTSDIEKAFLQVGLQESERDVTRFLWLKDVTKPVSKENLKIMRFGRVAFGFISSPFLLSATIKHHLAQDSSDVAKDMVNNVYVDNVFAVREQVPEAVEYYKTAKRLFAEIQMNIRQWSTNCPELREQIAETDQETEDCTKVLGMVWNTQKDVLSIRPPKRQMPEINSTATKRQVVSVFSTAFDPCGFLSPLVVRGKLLIQELWKCDVGWDDPVPRALIDDIHSAISEKSEIVAKAIEVPRAVPVGNAVIQLHTFCDASAKAYGAVA